NFSLSCWVYLSSDRNNYSTAWSVDAGTGNNICLQTNNDGTTMSVVSNGNLGTAFAMSVGNWYWIGFVKSGTSGTLYYSNGLGSISSFNRSVTSNVTATTLRFGESPWNGEWLNGRLAAAKVWIGVALTADQMASERTTYVPSRFDNLTAWYPFLVNGTADYSGNGQTLSGGSGTSTEDGPPISWGAPSVMSTGVEVASAANVDGTASATLGGLTATATGS